MAGGRRSTTGASPDLPGGHGGEEGDHWGVARAHPRLLAPLGAHGKVPGHGLDGNSGGRLLLEVNLRYGARKRTGREGKWADAHGACSGELGDAGDVLEASYFSPELVAAGGEGLRRASSLGRLGFD